MAIIIRNKNRCVYTIKSKIRRYIYYNLSMLKCYLKLKEIFIKNRYVIDTENTLFEKVFIETVSYCNNDCPFCPSSIRVGAKKQESFMSEDLYRKILNELAKISFKGSVAFHCNNEPLLDERLVLWVKEARNLLQTNFFYLYTNGILLDINLANKLFDSGLNRIIIDNYSDEYELMPSVRNIVDNSSVLRGEVIVNYRFKTDYLGNRAGESPNAKFYLKKPLKIICIRPSKEIVIGYDGTVPLCCADGLWKVTMGNVCKTALLDIWFSGFFKKIRKSLASGNRDCAEVCKVCDALNIPAPMGV